MSRVNFSAIFSGDGYSEEWLAAALGGNCNAVADIGARFEVRRGKRFESRCCRFRPERDPPFGRAQHRSDRGHVEAREPDRCGSDSEAALWRRC